MPVELEEETVGPGFRALLQRLGDEHERELQQLRVENASLRRSKLQCIDPEECCATEDVPSPPRSPCNGGGQHSPKTERSGANTPVSGERREDHSFKLKQPWRDAGNLQFGPALTTNDITGCISSAANTRRFGSTGIVRPMIEGSCDCLARLRRCCGLQGLVISPGSNWRFAWDIAALIFIGCDLIMIPLQAFNLPSTWFTDTLDWATLLFWTADVIQSFFVGYYAKGTVVMDLNKVMRRYVCTWFILDCVVVVPDWVLTCTKDRDGKDLVGVGRIFRGARAFRVLRLLRVLKLKRIMSSMLEVIESEHAFTMVNLVKLLVALFLLNHVIACAWYFLGVWCRNDGKPNWLDASFTTGKELDYQYLTSLHWSLTQFTPASMDVSARNVIERVFSILVLFFALVAFSSIVGSITASMTHLQNLRGDEMKQFWLLRRYLRQRQVNKALSIRILKFLEYQSARQQDNVQEGSLTILANLSGPLQNELVHEMTAPVLVQHPFFSHLCQELEVVMHRLVGTALRQSTLASMDIVFDSNELARRMYFVKSGDFEYRLHTHELLTPRLQPLEWVSEAALWTHWRHLGTLQALSPSELIQVDSTHFAEEMLKHPTGWSLSRNYAEAFLSRLNQTPAECLSDVLRYQTFPLDFDIDKLAALPSLRELEPQGPNGEQSRPNHAVQPSNDVSPVDSERARSTYAL